jgi:hypothetical protein
MYEEGLTPYKRVTVYMLYGEVLQYLSRGSTVLGLPVVALRLKIYSRARSRCTHVRARQRAHVRTHTRTHARCR